MSSSLYRCIGNLFSETMLAKLGLAFACLFAIASGADARAEILNWSNIAGPNDVANLQGEDFGEQSTVWCSTNGGAAQQLPTINRGNSVLHFRLPSVLGLYGVSVHNGDEVSNIVYPNRANPMHFDTPEIAAGGSFRIFGRNLFAAGFTPQVKFVSGSNSFDATINDRATYSILSVKAPEKIPLGKYTVYVSNGMGSQPLAQVSSPAKMIIAAAGLDAFNLRVPWAANLTFGKNIYNVRTDHRLSLHAVGDGKNNDQSAIQKAINTAGEAGGGVVYIPAGMYKMATSSGPVMNFASNVVVQGAGQGKTIINYGFGKPGEHFAVAKFSQASKCGLCDLSIQNLNENNAWLDTQTIMNEGSEVSQLFLALVKANFQNGARVELKGDRILVKNCNLSSIYTLLYLGTCTNSRVSNNTLTQMLGVHLDLTQSDQCVVDNNIFCLNANNGKVVPGNVRHGIAIGFAHNLAIIDNKWTTFNGNPSYNNDGESILSEGGGGIRIGEETGEVKSASDTTIGVSKSISFVGGTAIAIIKGRGTGQWRTITARNGNTITVNSPWAVNPDSTSNYSIFVWSNQNTTISGNTFTNWLRGVWIYQGSTTDTQISNNRFNGMDGIFIEPCQNVTNGNGQFNPVWNTIIDHNILSSGTIDPSVPKRKSAATYINFTGDLQQTSDLIGTMALNNQVYHNVINGTGATFFENDPAQTEGYCNYLRVEAPHYNDQGIPAMLGTVFQWDTANNCGAQSFLLNGGDYQTTLADCIEKTNAKTLKDSTDYWNTAGTHSSVGTIFATPAPDLE